MGKQSKPPVGRRASAEVSKEHSNLAWNDKKRDINTVSLVSNSNWLDTESEF